MVSNVRVRTGDARDELQVTSNILVYRNRSWETEADLFCGERQDVLRRIDGRWWLARRIVLLDPRRTESADMSAE
jgi:hypothetical protein